MGDNFFNLYLWTSSVLLSSTCVEELVVVTETFFTFSKDSFDYFYSTNYTFLFTLKLSICLIFLSAIRGGVPRYRYDFLTKMG